MDEPRFMLMVRAIDDGPHAPSLWGAVKVAGVGRVMTRVQAEAAAAHVNSAARFIFAYGADSARFGQASSAPALAIMAGETIWNYGEPARVDMLAALRVAAGRPTPGGSVPMPDPDLFALHVETVLEVAMERFGDADAHMLEAYIDRLVMDLGGVRYKDPPCYAVPGAVLGLA
jgi:hypothetical protein